MESQFQLLMLLPVFLSLSKICVVKSATVTILMLLPFMLSYLTLAQIPTTDSATKSIQCGDIDPVDPFYFIGERLNLTCTLWNSDNNETGLLYFDMAVNNNGAWSHVEVNQTGYEIIQLNSTAIQLTSPNLTIDDALRHNVSRSYRCMVREAVNSCTNNSTLFVKNELIRIDYYPHAPWNFTCQLDNWEVLTCTWDMIPYFHQKTINVNCFWTNGDWNDLNKGCEADIDWSPCPNGTFTSFTSRDFINVPNYTFCFKITNNVRNVVNTSAPFHIFTDHIVKPAPVDYIKFQAITDTCVTLVWDNSKSHRRKVFKVRYKSECSSEQQALTQYMNITVCDLNPYTNYTFIVDSRPVDIDSKKNSFDTVGFTSDPRSSSNLTKPAVPAANPKLLSYTDVPCINSTCRKVQVYWEPLSSCDLHDSPSSQQYEIITKTRGSEEMWNSIVNNSEATSHSLTLPDKEKVYEVKLRVITGHGKKREDFSHLVIWPRNKFPVTPSMIVEYDKMNNGTMFYITLTQMETQSQTSQLLYWCQSMQGSGCQKPKSFKEINGSYVEILVLKSLKDFNIRFGVEFQQPFSGEIIQSGIHMGTCNYKRNLKPLIPPKNFKIDKGIVEREGELSLKWDPYDCNSAELESGYVQSYNLYYCQVTDESCNLNLSKHNLKVISIKQNNHEYTIRELKPGGHYNVWLTARTSAGEGPATDVHDTYIYKQDFLLRDVILITAPCLIVIIVTIICSVKISKYIKGRRNAYQIEVPETGFQFDDYVQITHSNGQLGNGHVILDDQSTDLILDMDEKEELCERMALISYGDAKVCMRGNSSKMNLLVTSGQNDPIQLDMPIHDYKDDDSYISVNSSTSYTESFGDTKDKKVINQLAFGLVSEFDHNTNLLPDGYCRAVGNGDNIPEINSMLYEDILDRKLFKLQGQAVHSQSIDSLLNDNPELEKLNLLLVDECNENSCEREKDIHSVSAKDSLNLPQKHVMVGKPMETIQITITADLESNELHQLGYDFQSNELCLSGDNLRAAISDDSLCLLEEIISFDMTEKNSGYVCANEVQDEVDEPLLSNSYFSFDAGSDLDEVSTEPDDGHVRHETDNIKPDMNNLKSEMDCMRYENNHESSEMDCMNFEKHVRSKIDSAQSKNDHVTSDSNEIIYDELETMASNDMRCNDYIVRTNNSTVISADEASHFSNNLSNSID